jgi:hypothetical protein
MNVSLDLSNRPALLKLRDEYRRVLDIIDYALERLPDTIAVNGEMFPPQHRPMGLPLPPSARVTAPSVRDAALYDLLPEAFTVTQLRTMAPVDRPMTRDMAKHALNKWKEAGLIEVHTKGVGGIQSVYRKCKPPST